MKIKTHILARAFLLWTIWVIFYALVMKLQVREIPLAAALISSANYNYTFAGLSVLIWLICRRIRFEKTRQYLFIAGHFFLAVFFSALWLVIVYGLGYLAMGTAVFELVRFREIIGWQFLFGVITYFLVAGIFYTLIYYKNFKQEQMKEAELKILMRDAELKALKLQMNPHFLFNVLNSINALVTQNAALARRMIAKLSDLLRMSLDTHEKLFIPLRQELDLVHSYLEIEGIRFRDKMDFHEEIDPELLSQPFPAMLLQPLIENAVKHGIANRLEAGKIQLSLKKSGQVIIGRIINTSDSLSRTADTDKNGLGLSNIRKRLGLLYGDQYQFVVDASEANTFQVRFELPLNWTRPVE